MRRSYLRRIECFGRLKQGDVAGAESAARLAIEAACAGRAFDVVNAARDIAVAFCGAGHHDAARRVRARAARLGSYARESSGDYDAFAKLAVDQHRRGDLAYAVAWVNELASPFVS